MNDPNVQRIEVSSRKDPWLAVLLSKVFPGVGQIYSGESARGIFFIAITIALFCAMVISVVGFLVTDNAHNARTCAVGFLVAAFIMLIVSIYALFDAYKVTKRRKPDDTQTVAVAGYRKAWLAAFLSALIPGIGQFYNRHILKGLALLVLSIVIDGFESVYTPLVLVGLLVYVFGIKDAFDSAEKLNGSSNRFFQQNKIVLLFMMFMFTLQLIPYAKLIKENVVEAFKLPSGSMYPTLKIGDCFLLGKSRPFFGSLQRGDIVVFPYPKSPEKNFVKRVIGLGGDKIQFINGELYINEQQVPSKKLDVQEEDDHLWLNTIGPPTVYEERIGDVTYRVQYLRDKSTTNNGPWLVPQDSVFVLGDNRDNSQDSRVWGAVKRDGVKGKAMKIYWSWDRAASRVRWERIGETIH